MDSATLDRLSKEAVYHYRTMHPAMKDTKIFALSFESSTLLRYRLGTVTVKGVTFHIYKDWQGNHGCDF